jgi:hypothetical protein
MAFVAPTISYDVVRSIVGGVVKALEEGMIIEVELRTSKTARNDRIRNLEVKHIILDSCLVRVDMTCG